MGFRDNAPDCCLGNGFAAIEWVGHASKLQPDDEGMDDIHSEVMNSHSLVKTIGTVFGAYLGRAA